MSFLSVGPGAFYLRGQGSSIGGRIRAATEVAKMARLEGLTAGRGIAKQHLCRLVGGDSFKKTRTREIRTEKMRARKMMRIKKV